MTNFDLAVLGAILVFATFGAFAGAARQVAQALAVAAGFAAAGPLGTLAGPSLAKQAQVPLTLGVVLASAFSFFVVFLTARAIGTALLLRALAGKEAKNRSLDRTLGFVIGGAKVFALVWVALSALTWAEDKISVGGKKLLLAPKDSVALALARQYNVFDRMQFSGIDGLQALATADPKALAKLKNDANYQALARDPRLLRLLGNDGFRRELKARDAHGLLAHDDVTSLLQDAVARQRIDRLAQQLSP